MPAGETYTKLRSVTLSSPAAEISFSNIPQSYTDLVIVASARYVSTNAGQGLGIRFNGDTTSNYSFSILEGNGSAASSYRVSNTTSGAMGAVANGSQSSFAVVSTSIQNYTNNTTNKTYITRQSGPSFVQGIVGLWRATPAPITSISIIGSGTSGNIDSGSTFTLYGIAASSAPQASGGTITTDGTYWIHTFTSSGVFTPISGLQNVDYLVVAGGGGGGKTVGGGGGGAGGLRCTVGATGGGGSLETPLSLSPGVAYTVTVGAGGVGGSGSLYAAVPGSNGNNSVFATITSIAGGGGGTSAADGLSGGSGGGGCLRAASGGAGTANQGFAGGTGSTVSNANGGGGGGGAGAAGAAVTSANGTNGGAGITTSINGSSLSYAGGGGGGGDQVVGASIATTGGSGVGGAGAVGGNGSNAIANRGGGGGGSGRDSGNGFTWTGGNGGSGIVIVRYLVNG